MIVEELENKISNEVQDRHFSTFSKQAVFLGNGIYEIAGRYSTDTRELFLMYCADREGIIFETEEEEEEEYE